MDYIVHEILQARILEWVAFHFSRGSYNPGIKPRCPTLQADSIPAEPPGRPCGKESACSVGDLGSIPGWEDPLEKGKATPFSVLAWRIPWTV